MPCLAPCLAPYDALFLSLPRLAPWYKSQKSALYYRRNLRKIRLVGHFRVKIHYYRAKKSKTCPVFQAQFEKKQIDFRLCCPIFQCILKKKGENSQKSARYYTCNLRKNQFSVCVCLGLGGGLFALPFSLPSTLRCLVPLLASSCPLAFDPCHWALISKHLPSTH